MTKSEHIAEAERQLASAISSIEDKRPQHEIDRAHDRARTHALLAVALTEPAPAAASVTAPKTV